MMKKPTNCKDCGELLSDEIILKQLCRCKECQLAYNRKMQNKRKIKQNLEKYKDRTDMVECKECGWKVEQTGSLYQHIKMHGLTKESYCEKFNCTNDALFGKTFSEATSQRTRGELNPAYQHGGKLSSLSKNFIKYENMDDKERDEQIKKVSEKISDSNQNNGNNNTTLLYWLNLGYSEEEAMEKLTERQTTFSKEICIQKYGKVDGLKRWNERQELWQNNLPHSNYSKISQQLFWNIYHSLPVEHQKECFFIEATKREYKIGRFKVDFYIKTLNIAVEFQGDYWHANPKIYKENAIINGKIAKDIWKNDEIREHDLAVINPGLTMIIVWESEYKKNPQETVQRVLDEIALNQKY